MFDVLSDVSLTDIFIIMGDALTTVTSAPIGLFSSMCSFTFEISSLSAGRLSASTITTFTVPAPFQSGITFTSPTPLTSFAHSI